MLPVQRSNEQKCHLNKEDTEIYSNDFFCPYLSGFTTLPFYVFLMWLHGVICGVIVF